MQNKIIVKDKNKPHIFIAESPNQQKESIITDLMDWKKEAFKNNNFILDGCLASYNESKAFDLIYKNEPIGQSLFNSSFIHTFYIVKEHRNHGRGKEFVKFIKAYIKKTSKADHLRIMSSQSAVPFWVSCGGVIIADHDNGDKIIYLPLGGICNDKCEEARKSLSESQRHFEGGV